MEPSDVLFEVELGRRECSVWGPFRVQNAYGWSRWCAYSSICCGCTSLRISVVVSGYGSGSSGFHGFCVIRVLLDAPGDELQRVGKMVGSDGSIIEIMEVARLEYTWMVVGEPSCGIEYSEWALLFRCYAKVACDELAFVVNFPGGNFHQ